MIYTKKFHIEIASRVSEISTIANLTGAYGNGKNGSHRRDAEKNALTNAKQFFFAFDILYKI